VRDDEGRVDVRTDFLLEEDDKDEDLFCSKSCESFDKVDSKIILFPCSLSDIFLLIQEILVRG
jgi:hypothetical protein